MKQLLLILFLCAAVEAGTVREFEWRGTGMLHGIPVQIEADVEKNFTWSMKFWHAPKPGEQQLHVYLELAGSWERDANKRLIFTSPYANARVVFEQECETLGLFNCRWVQKEQNIDMHLDLKDRSDPTP